MGLNSEQPENVTVVVPVAVAQKFVDAKTDDQKQAAILEAQIFLNGGQRYCEYRSGGLAFRRQQFAEDLTDAHADCHTRGTDWTAAPEPG